MHDPAFQHVIGRESRLCGTAAQIGFLEIEKKAFVKQTDPVQHRLAHHQTGPRQPIHTARRLRHRLRHDPAPQKAAYRAEPHLPFKFRSNRRKAESGVMGRVILTKNGTPGKTRCRMPVQMINQSADCRRFAAPIVSEDPSPDSLSTIASAPAIPSIACNAASAARSVISAERQFKITVSTVIAYATVPERPSPSARAITARILAASTRTFGSSTIES